MKYNTVSSLCEGIAESIRRKEGSTEKINPQDFVERIEALQLGGGGEEYGIYLKILDVDTNIDGDIDSTLTSDSPEVAEFFSDAFGWLSAIGNESNFYEMYEALGYHAIVSYEVQKKTMGLQNVYDSLPQKRIPLLALRTKPTYGDDGSLLYGEKILLLNDVYDGRNTSEKDIYCNIAGCYNTIGLEYYENSGLVCIINPNGIRIIEVD